MPRPGTEPDPQQLPLFDDALPAPMAPIAPIAAVSPSSPIATAAAAAIDAPVAPRAEPIAFAPAAAPQPASSPPSENQRHVQLGQHPVAYTLRRGRRRSIGFVVGPEGLTVSAPRWVAQRDIDTALREKSQWILRKLHEVRERQRKVEASRIEWREGASIPFLGEPVVLVLDPRCTGAVLNSEAEALPGVPRLALHLGLPQNADAAQIRDVVQSWLQRQARRVFEERCAIYADRLGVRMTRLTLSSASTRWGSASADGSIRLNWRLVHFGVSVIDYVVTHELAHLREMNHSEAFWEVVRSVMPDYERALGTLKDHVLPALD